MSITEVAAVDQLNASSTSSHEAESGRHGTNTPTGREGGGSSERSRNQKLIKQLRISTLPHRTERTTTRTATATSGGGLIPSPGMSMAHSQGNNASVTHGSPTSIHPSTTRRRLRGYEDITFTASAKHHLSTSVLAKLANARAYGAMSSGSQQQQQGSSPSYLQSSVGGGEGLNVSSSPLFKSASRGGGGGILGGASSGSCSVNSPQPHHLPQTGGGGSTVPSPSQQPLGAPQGTTPTAAAMNANKQHHHKGPKQTVSYDLGVTSYGSKVGKDDAVAQVVSSVVGILEDGKHIVTLDEATTALPPSQLDQSQFSLEPRLDGSNQSSALSPTPSKYRGAVIGGTEAAEVDLSLCSRPTVSIAKQTILTAPGPLGRKEVTAFTVERPSQFLDSVTTTDTRTSTKTSEKTTPMVGVKGDNKNVTHRTVVKVVTTTVKTVTRSKALDAATLGVPLIRPTSAMLHRSSSGGGGDDTASTAVGSLRRPQSAALLRRSSSRSRAMAGGSHIGDLSLSVGAVPHHNISPIRERSTSPLKPEGEWDDDRETGSSAFLQVDSITEDSETLGHRLNLTPTPTSKAKWGSGPAGPAAARRRQEQSMSAAVRSSSTGGMPLCHYPCGFGNKKKSVEAARGFGRTRRFQ